ncbi:hypothetical protein BGZ80_005404, partial [Entomortierella chlamydospora]
MLDKHLTLFFLVDGEATSNVFPVEIESGKTVGGLKDAIKTALSPQFDDITAKDLTLWRVSIPITEDNDNIPILLNNVANKDKKKPGPATHLSKVFTSELPEETINIIVQRPPPVQAPVPVRALTPLPSYPSDDSRPSTPLSGDLRVDIKKITDKFFATGSPIATFLDEFVKGKHLLPTTSG